MKRLITFSSVLLFLALSATAKERVESPLKSAWEFKQVRGHKWYPATVPGVVHTDLMDQGIIEDPFIRLNERGVQWVDKEDWEYKTLLEISPEVKNKKHIDLVFDGLDTYADVYLNDSLIIKADNMFRQWRKDVTPLLKNDSNVLRVYFHNPYKIDVPKFDALPYQLECANDQSENGGIFDKKVSVFAR
ncbi:MAG: glycosyl hydrolase 2 galactose-binding domain-containing protein, partial [Bacteroidales bacterium]